MNPDDSNVPRPHFRVLSSQQIEAIHCAALRILEQTGVEVRHPEALHLLEDAGARIERETRVHIPQALAEDALHSAPSEITLWRRSGEVGFVLRDFEYHFGIMADCPDVIDPHTGLRRAMRAADIGNSARLADALPNLHFICEAGWAPDHPVHLADRVCFRQVLTGTSKPLGFCCTDSRTLVDILDMAALVAGGRDALSARPFLFHYAEPTSPLVHTEQALGKLLLCAQANIPLVYTPMPISGASAPASFAGTLVLNVAECLSGLVIAQLKQPGAPVVFGGIPGPLDMRTTIFPYGAPELQLMVAALTDIAHYYHLPMFGTAGGTDSKTFDEQAAAECTMTCLLAVQSGANLIHDVGFLDHCSVTSYDMMVLADEVIGMVSRITQSISVSEDELGVELIQRVGPGGNFMAEPHTLQRFRKWWRPSIFDRSASSANASAVTLGARIRTKVLSILEAHRPEPLSEDILHGLDELERTWI